MYSLINRAAFTPVSTLKLMSTFTSVSWSVSFIIGTWEDENKILWVPRNATLVLLSGYSTYMDTISPNKHIYQDKEMCYWESSWQWTIFSEVIKIIVYMTMLTISHVHSHSCYVICLYLQYLSYFVRQVNLLNLMTKGVINRRYCTPITCKNCSHLT